MNKDSLEWIILVALFKATVEQQEMLRGETKQQAKLIFNRWNKQGNQMLDIIEKNSNIEALDQITDIIHNSIKTIKTEYNELQRVSRK